MLANYHTHTFRCRHAWGEDKEYVEAAISSGMKILGFSDHCPWIFEDGYVSGTRMLPSQLDDYFSSMEKLKNEYRKDIKIYAGFESEYIPGLMEAQNRLLSDYPVDYMILGEHFTGKEPCAPYTGFPSESETELKKYVDLIIEGMETGKYIYLAHPDLFNFTGSYEIYEFHFKRLCRYLKEKNIPVEINLLGVVENRHYTSEKFLSIAAETGNSVIIGCDAHTPDRLSFDDGINACIKMAEKFGLKIVDSLPGLE
ncbi:MAG: histidinol-phosphatase [Porcipelethomonas sp.]